MLTYEDRAALRVCAGLEEYVARCDQWRPGAPFPVLDGPELERYAELVRSLGSGLPAPVLTRADGVVVSAGGEVARAAALLLARASARPHSHLAADELAEALEGQAGTPVAVVGLTHDLGAPAARLLTANRPVGLVTARTATALTALAYRTVTVSALPLEDTYVVSAMGLPGADTADAMGMDDLIELRERHVGTLVLRTHGRECSVFLPDGVLCGRSDADAPAAPSPPFAEPGKRVTSCMRGAGCYHMFIGEEQRVPACEVRASFVFSQSCLTVSVGTNAFPAEVGVGLGFLDGTTVGLVGPIGKHIDTRAVREVYDRCPAGGWLLGDLVVRLNALGSELSGEQLEFALLGDPALRLPATGSAAAAPAAPGPFDARVAPAELIELEQVVLPRMERLRWLELDVDEDVIGLRREVRELARRVLRWGPAPADVRALTETAAPRGARRIVAKLLETIHATWWQFETGALPGLEVISRERTACAECHRDDASRIVLRHRVEPDLRLLTVQCPACGDLYWSTDEAEQLTMTGQLVYVAESGSRLVVRRTLVNRTARPLRGALGFSFYEGVRSSWPQLPARELDLGPRDREEIEFAIDLPESGPVRDEHPGVVVAMADGHCYATPVVLSLA